MPTIATSKELVRLCRQAQISLFLWGSHGIGKSSLVREFTEEHRIGFVDLRCAQLDAIDLRGFPSKGRDGRTHFLPPADLPAKGEGILFLDELNRANVDILAALFQLVLDRRVGQYQLPPGWSIVAAGNFQTDDYDVNELDVAFCDRFCHTIVSADRHSAGEWAQWMMQQHGRSAYRAVNYCVVNQQHLERRVPEQLPFQVHPSRRSWEAVVRGIRVADQGDFSSETRLAFVSGLVGPDLAVSFLNYQPTLSPDDIFNVGVRSLRPPFETM